MPAVNSGKILVTGASGYIGAWGVKYLVDRGYTVVAALRTQEQANFLVNRLPEYKGKVSTVIVADIEAEGAYDKAVVGVDGILHFASPVKWSWEDPNEVIGPALNGATNILKSAAKQSSVKRVVLTSSSVAVVAEDGKPDVIYGEEGYNETAVKYVEKEGKASNPWAVYNASKTLAEKAAWDFVAKEKPSFDLSTVLPVYNFGAFLIDTKKGLTSTLAVFQGKIKEPDTSGSLAGDFVDARDSALLHVLALGTPAAGGKRILSTAETFSWQDFYDILNDAGFKNIPGKDTYGAGKNKAKGPSMHNKTSLSLFPGFKYRTKKESITDLANELVALGAI